MSTPTRTFWGLRRVAEQYPEGRLTRAVFSAASTVSWQTVLRRFGSWQAALIEAGLADRYRGIVVAPRRTELARQLTNDQVLAELRRLADADGVTTFTAVLLVR